MRFGFYLPSSGPTAQPEALSAIARRGDELGFHCMVAGDHILVPREVNSPYPYTADGRFHGGNATEFMEQLTLLTFLAGITQTIRLVPSVMIVPYRNPLLAAKILATLDVLSRGRLTLGVGVGWMEEEFEALDAPPFAERGAVTNEYLRPSRSYGPATTRLLRVNIAVFPTLTSCPSRCRNPIRPSGLVGRAAGQYAAPPNWAMAGTR